VAMLSRQYPIATTQRHFIFLKWCEWTRKETGLCKDTAV